MYEQETIVDKYTILGVDVLIKEHQFPDSNEIWYHAFFQLGSEYHMIRDVRLVSLRRDIHVMLHNYYLRKAIDNPSHIN